MTGIIVILGILVGVICYYGNQFLDLLEEILEELKDYSEYSRGDD